MKLIVGISGASGSIYGIRLLEELRKKGIETHLIISPWGGFTLEKETNYKLDSAKTLASRYYSHEDLSAPVSSGTFKHDGMIIAPCSMKTLSGIAYGFTDNLLIRAADVTIKEGRKLVLLVRETPLNVIHLENMLKLARLGVVIMPPVPAFYTKPASIEEIVEQTVGRACELFNITLDGFKIWQ